jgi:hypothetical protein
MKTTKSTAAVKVLGYFRKGSALGDLAEILADHKTHKLGRTLETIRKRHKTTKTWRGYGVLRTVGKSKRAFSITVDRAKDTIQLKGGVKKASPKKATTKPTPISVAA